MLAAYYSCQCGLNIMKMIICKGKPNTTQEHDEEDVNRFDGNQR